MKTFKEFIAELSKDTLQRYYSHSVHDMHANAYDHRNDEYTDEKRWNKRRKGQKQAIAKLKEEENLSELDSRGLNAYRRSAEEDMADEINKPKPNWNKVTKRQHGISMALSKMRNIDVKVKASDCKKKPWPLHPIRVVTKKD